MILINRRGRGSGDAMVRGKLPAIWMKLGQGPTALAVGADAGLWTFPPSFLPLSET